MTGLSAADAAAFRANGYHFPLRLMSEAEAGVCRKRVEDFERAHPDAVGKLDLKANLLFPWVDAVTRHPALLDAVEAILGPDLICWNASFRNKKRRSPTYAGWHQDTRYITVRPPGVIAVVALTPANAQSGTVRVIPGSNNWDVLPHRDTHDKDSPSRAGSTSRPNSTPRKPWTWRCGRARSGSSITTPCTARAPTNRTTGGSSCCWVSSPRVRSRWTESA